MDEASFDYPTDDMPARRRIETLLTSGDWMARIIIESMLIVFSILAALGVNEWQVARENDRRARQALAAFQREIEQNRARLATVSPVHQGLRDVLLRISDEGGLRTAEAFHQTVGMEPLRPPFVTSTVWETSLTTGAIPHIDFEVVNALSLTYSLQDRLAELSRSSMPTLARGGSVSPGQMPRALNEVIAYLTDLGRSEEDLLAAYDEVLRILAEASPADSTAVQRPLVAGP